MKLLILGGTRFLGPGAGRSAQARGHQLTLFNRGQSNPGLFPEVEQLTGDRTVDLHPLQGRQWDAVIDTCGYEPAVVRARPAVARRGPSLRVYLHYQRLRGCQPARDR